MKNVTISDKEREAVKKVLEAVEELTSIRNDTKFPDADSISTVEKIHSLLYLSFIGDLKETIEALTSLLDENEEKFIQIITEKGKYNLDEVLVKAMIGVMSEIVHK